MTILTRALAASLAAGAAMTLAAPAASAHEPYSTGRYTLPPINKGNLQRDIRQLDREIARSASRGVISRRDARKLTRQLDGASRTYREFARGGLSYREAMIIDYQIDQLRGDLRRAKNYTPRAGKERRLEGHAAYQPYRTR